MNGIVTRLGDPKRLACEIVFDLNVTVRPATRASGRVVGQIPISVEIISAREVLIHRVRKLFRAHHGVIYAACWYDILGSHSGYDDVP